MAVAALHKPLELQQEDPYFTISYKLSNSYTNLSHSAQDLAHLAAFDPVADVGADLPGHSVAGPQL